MARVLKWNGRDLPEELRELPPGRYIVESVDTVPTLSPEEEEDLIQSLREAEAGEGLELGEARRRIDAALKH